jgi:hypothetical protein
VCTDVLDESAASKLRAEEDCNLDIHHCQNCRSETCFKVSLTLSLVKVRVDSSGDCDNLVVSSNQLMLCDSMFQWISIFLFGSFDCYIRYV